MRKNVFNGTLFIRNLLIELRRFFSLRHNCVPDTALDSYRKSISCFGVSAGDDYTNHFNFIFSLVTSKPHDVEQPQLFKLI